MTDYESIYKNHYEGETYRFGVAYLRQEADSHDPDHYAETYPSLEEQRHIVAALAHRAETLVIAEFTDTCEQIPASERPELNELLDFWQDTNPQVMFAASEEVLGFDTHDNFFVRAALGENAVDRIVTER